jgi:hypothetical protein
MWIRRGANWHTNQTEGDVGQRKTLTEWQVEVLRWIGDGCPGGVMEGDKHRISAAALRNRGFVTTSGRGDTWLAKITGEGREYLDQVDGPEPPIPRQANVSVTQQLVDDVIAAGGSLRVSRKNWYGGGGVDYAKRVLLAERHGKVPPGKRLTVHKVSQEELEIELLDAPGYAVGRAELVPVHVPAKVGRFSAAALEFRRQAERHEVSRKLLPRATRIVHAIAIECGRRSWSVRASSESKNGYGRTDWTGTKDGHIHITAKGHEFWLRVQEDGVRTRGPWEEEVRRYRNVSSDSLYYRDRELPRGAYDADASGRLKLELHVPRPRIFPGRQSQWSDRQSWILEDRLPHLFREIEERIAEADRFAEKERIAAEKAAEAARREAEERERQWKVLMDDAKHRLVETHRAEQLRSDAARWTAAQTLRRYCDAVQASYGDRSETAEWLAWARVYVSQLDPLSLAPVMPEDPEPTIEALQQHLPDGWSAHGPEYGDGRRRW